MSPEYIDRSIPRYIQVANEIENRIEDGLLKPSQALPTFRELSEQYGISIVTVNHTIKELDSRGQIIRKRGKGVYVASPGQKKQKSHNVGLVVPDITSPYFASLAKIIQQDFLNNNYGVLIHSTDGDLVNLNRCLRQLTNRKVDGIILIPLEINRPEQEEALWKLKIKRIPFVYMDDQFSRVPSDYVILDVRRGVQDIAEHLLSLGHRDFGCISAQPYIEITSIKIQTFIESLAQHHIRLDQEQIIISEERHDDGGFEATLKLLKSPTRPTAIFATNDSIAVGAIRATKSLGLQVPKDVSIAGFDDIHLAQVFDPPITTVAQPVEDIARTATDILMQRINGELTPEFQQVVFPPYLVVRESTAPPVENTQQKRSLSNSP